MPGDISRRTVIASAAIVPVAALTASAQQAAAPVFSPAQLRTLTAFVDRLIPTDELGPGASESGVTEFISRSMADYLAPEKRSFVEGLEATDAFARKSQGMAFAELPSEKQDAVLTAMEAGTADGFPTARAFFAGARRLTLEGMFGDPYYGGNRNFAGWDLIGYPGPRLASTPADQKMGVEVKPYHHSAYSGSGEDHGH